LSFVLCALIRVSSCDFVDRLFATSEERSTKSHELTRIKAQSTKNKARVKEQ